VDRIKPSRRIRLLFPVHLKKQNRNRVRISMLKNFNKRNILLMKCCKQFCRHSLCASPVYFGGSIVQRIILIFARINNTDVVCDPLQTALQQALHVCFRCYGWDWGWVELSPVMQMPSSYAASRTYLRCNHSDQTRRMLRGRIMALSAANIHNHFTGNWAQPILPVN
jgi:hypothetical protein